MRKKRCRWRERVWSGKKRCRVPGRWKSRQPPKREVSSAETWSRGVVRVFGGLACRQVLIGLVIDKVPGTLVRGCVTAGRPAAAEVSDTGELLLARTLRGACCIMLIGGRSPFGRPSLQDTGHSAEQPATRGLEATDRFCAPSLSSTAIYFLLCGGRRGSEFLFRCLKPSLSARWNASPVVHVILHALISYWCVVSIAPPPAILIPRLIESKGGLDEDSYSSLTKITRAGARDSRTCTGDTVDTRIAKSARAPKTREKEQICYIEQFRTGSQHLRLCLSARQ